MMRCIGNCAPINDNIRPITRPIISNFFYYLRYLLVTLGTAGAAVIMIIMWLFAVRVMNNKFVALTEARAAQDLQEVQDKKATALAGVEALVTQVSKRSLWAYQSEQPKRGLASFISPKIPRLKN